MRPIFTLNARENVLLQLVRDFTDLGAPEVRTTIQEMHRTTEGALSSKGLNYQSLKAALVPSTDRHEAGFVFDSTKIGSSWYGFEMMKKVLPLLDKRTPQSILVGDLLCNNQRFIAELLEGYLFLSRPFTFRHSSALYCIYINNLSETAWSQIHKQLCDFPAYLGFVPATFASPAKTYLSMTLVNSFIKIGKHAITEHEDDRSNAENCNLIGYPFKECGYDVLSLQSKYFGVFLSFKIERAAKEADTEMALGAISDRVLPLRDFSLVLDKAKYQYLHGHKRGSLRKAKMLNLDRDKLVSFIHSKITANYLYNLTYLERYNVMKFNIMIEAERDDGGYPARLAVSLEYQPDERSLRVITLF